MTKWKTGKDALFLCEDGGCIDIQVPEEAVEVTLELPVYRLGGCTRSYPNVKRLMIDPDVAELDMTNRLFPNVEQVVSLNNAHFLTNPCLVYQNDAHQTTLLNAFCKKKKDVISLDDIKKISGLAFEGCNACLLVHNLKDLKNLATLPAKIILDDLGRYGLDTIRDSLSKYGLKEIASNVQNRYQAIDGILYTADKTTVIICPMEKTGMVTIPEGVRRVRAKAFCESKIQHVVLPDSLQSIEEQAFRACRALESIDFGHGLEMIGGNGHQDVFSGCTALKEITVPSQVKQIGPRAFAFCNALQRINFSNGLKTIKQSAFMQASSLSDVTLPASLNKIGADAFFRTGSNKTLNITVQSDQIPNGFVQSVGSNYITDFHYTLVNHKDNTFVLPDAMPDSYRGYYNERLPRGDYEKEIVSLFAAARTMYGKINAAIAACQYTKIHGALVDNKEAKDYLRNHEETVVRYFTREREEKDFIQFLSWYSATPCKHQLTILDLLQEKHWVNATAYFLEKTRNSQPDVLSLS